MHLEPNIGLDHLRGKYRFTNQADTKQRHTWSGKQPLGSTQKPETKMSPSVTPPAQMRRTIPTVFMQDDRNFRHFEAIDPGLDDHLRSPLHAGRYQIDASCFLGTECTHPAVEVRGWDFEQLLANERQNRIAKITV